MDFFKLNKFKSKSTKNISYSSKDQFIVPPSSPSLSPGITLSKQQQILEYRRNGGKKKVQVNSGGGGGGPPTGGSNLQNNLDWMTGGAGKGRKEGGVGMNQSTNHSECKKRETQLRQEIAEHAKYIEGQATALHRMEQTITYQYAIIQQLSQQIESFSSGPSGPPPQQGRDGGGGGGLLHASADPLAQLTKQFEQMSGSGGDGGGSKRLSSKRHRNPNQQLQPHQSQQQSQVTIW